MISVLISILLNLVTLAVNSAVSDQEDPNYVIMMIFTVPHPCREHRCGPRAALHNEVDGSLTGLCWSPIGLVFVLVVISAGLVAMIAAYTI
jgi:hypothetical protein